MGILQELTVLVLQMYSNSKTTEVNYNLNSGDLEYFTFFIF